jgi:hypothetical protein
VTDYADLKKYKETYEEYMDADITRLHPEDAVEFCRHVATHATKKADEQAAINDRIGVPERPREEI